MPSSGSQFSFWSWKPKRDNIFLSYLRDSDAHGFPYIGGLKQLLIERIFWFGCVLAGVVISGTMINELIIQPLIASPVLISYNDKETSIAQVPFPAVTICDTNVIRKLSWKEVEGELLRIRELLRANKSLTVNETDFFQTGLKSAGFLTSLCSSGAAFSDRIAAISRTAELEYALRNMGDVSGSHIFQKVMQYIQPILNKCSNTVLKCMWNGKEINCTESFYPVQTEYGFCCVFNMMPPFVLRTTDQARKRSYKAMSPAVENAWRNWNIDKSLILDDVDLSNRKRSKVPLRQIKSGSTKGLSVLLNIQPQQHYNACRIQDSDGFRVEVHSPIDNPKVSMFGKTITPNSETFLGVQAEIVTTTDDLKTMRLKKRRCYYLNNYKLLTFKFYTQQNCFDECITMAILGTCKCILFHMPRVNHSTFCTKLDDFHCIGRLRKNISERGIRSFCRHCWPACTAISYRGDTTRLPLRDDVDLWKLTDKDSPKWENMSFSIVHVFFNKNEVESRLRASLYGIEDIVGDAGGFLGLTLGISFIAAAEPIYLLVLWGIKMICGFIYKIFRPIPIQFGYYLPLLF